MRYLIPNYSVKARSENKKNIKMENISDCTLLSGVLEELGASQRQNLWTTW